MFSFPRGLLFTAIQITSCIYWKRPSLSKNNFLKQLVGLGFCFFFFLSFFYFSCRPTAHLVIAAHESGRICVTGPGHWDHFYSWIRTPYFRKETSVVFATTYLWQQTKSGMEMRCEGKAFLSLESAMELIFNITRQWKQTQAAIPALCHGLPCMCPNTARSATLFTCCKTQLLGSSLCLECKQRTSVGWFFHDALVKIVSLINFSKWHWVCSKTTQWYLGVEHDNENKASYGTASVTVLLTFSQSFCYIK